MINFLKKIFSSGPQADFAYMVSKGAMILDVRTKAEYNSGHIKGSLNIPLNELPSRIRGMKKGQEIITCCASGVRSASAQRILKSGGFEKVHNGGGWQSLQRKLKK